METQQSFAERLSVGIARTIDRRAFFRKTAGTAFKAAAVLAAGGALAEVSGAPAWADCGACAGPGCPKVVNYKGQTVSKGCGPSRCCGYTSGLASGCNCWSSSNTCISGTYHCRGATGYCWSCAVVTLIASNGCQYGYVTTCCDCQCYACSTKGCTGVYDNICIRYSSIYKKFGC
jgi:hypothetical protein